MEAIFETILFILIVIVTILYIKQRNRAKLIEKMHDIAKEESERMINKVVNLKKLHQHEKSFEANRERALESMRLKNQKETDENINKMLESQKNAEQIKKKLDD